MQKISASLNEPFARYGHIRTPVFGICLLSWLFVWVSWRIEGSIFFETACVIIRKTLPSTTYISRKWVKSFDLTTQAFYLPVSSLYGQAHINVESETLGESIYADPTLVFSRGCRPQRIISASICPLSGYVISWEIAISKNLGFHQKPIFVTIVRTKRNGVEGWNF